MQTNHFSNRSFSTENTIAQQSDIKNAVQKFMNNNEFNISSFVQQQNISIYQNIPNGFFSRVYTDKDTLEFKISSRKSILKIKDSTLNTRKPRNDTFGNVIRTKGKEHRIRFSELVHVKEVENWKKYNINDEVDVSSSRDSGGGCCDIF